MQHLNSRLVEQAQIAIAFNPVDLAAGNVASDWVSLKNYERLSIVLIKNTGTGTEDPVITLQQAVNVAGGSAKPLTVTRFDRKTGADLQAIGQFTAVNQAAANTVTVEGGETSITVIDILPETMDVDAGFDCVNFTIADPGTTVSIACGLFILWGPRYGGLMPSAIVN